MKNQGRGQRDEIELHKYTTSKLQLVVPLIEYPDAWSSRPGKASPEICRPSIAGRGSSSTATQ